MKKLILIMIFILCLPLVYSIYGGEKWTYHFNECKELRINITGTEEIDEGEYTILNDCEENQTNYYICDCENNYDFNVTFNINAVNNYTFDFNYDYDRFEKEETQSSGSSGGGGGSGGGSTYYKFTGKTGAKVFYMTPNVFSRLTIKGNTHKIIVKEVGKDYVIAEIHSNITRIRLELNKTVKIDLDQDNKYDLSLTLKEIRGRMALIEIKEIKVEVSEEKETKELVKEETETEPETKEPVKEEPIVKETEEKGMSTGWKIAIVLIVIVAIGVILYVFRKKE